MIVNVISEKQQEFNGVTYYLCVNYYQKNGVRLHRVVWKYHNGTIPKGCHIHHKDTDRNNNQIDNLELKTANKHLSEHMTEEKRKMAREYCINVLQPKAAEWHGTDEGKKWHSERGKENWKLRKDLIYKCTQCGKEFETKNIYAKDSNHFCSNNCKSAFRRASKVDSVTRICKLCEEEFQTNKYSQKKYCCLTCSSKARWGK